MVEGIPIAPLALPREFPTTEFPAVFFHLSTGWELGFGPKLSGKDGTPTLVHMVLCPGWFNQEHLSVASL